MYLYIMYLVLVYMYYVIIYSKSNNKEKLLNGE